MDEIEEIKKRYERRKNLPDKNRYSCFNTGNLFILQERQRRTLDLLKKYGFDDLGGKTILEIGCGNGGWLRDLEQWGAKPERLFGVDLLEYLIKEAKSLSPNMHFTCGNAEVLDFDDKTFDLVLIATCFTSILDHKMKSRIAIEAMRVLKDTGSILWYDFRFDNPFNHDVKGIGKKEIKELFGKDRLYDLKSVTLAPPLVRALAPYSRLVCELLAKLPFLKTHYLAIIKK